jgi:hypothetical protein
MKEKKNAILSTPSSCASFDDTYIGVVDAMRFRSLRRRHAMSIFDSISTIMRHQIHSMHRYLSNGCSIATPWLLIHRAVWMVDCSVLWTHLTGAFCNNVLVSLCSEDDATGFFQAVFRKANDAIEIIDFMPGDYFVFCTSRATRTFGVSHCHPASWKPDKLEYRLVYDQSKWSLLLLAKHL